MSVSASDLIEDQIKPLKSLYEGGKDGPQLFWAELRKKIDPLSVRQYLGQRYVKTGNCLGLPQVSLQLLR
jgi:hypothetical protein